MQRYGFYPNIYPLDVADTQDLLPKGARVRNKKQKRRCHKKGMRQFLKQQTRRDVLSLH